MPASGVLGSSVGGNVDLDVIMGTSLGKGNTGTEKGASGFP